MSTIKVFYERLPDSNGTASTKNGLLEVLSNLTEIVQFKPEFYVERESEMQDMMVLANLARAFSDKDEIRQFAGIAEEFDEGDYHTQLDVYFFNGSVRGITFGGQAVFGGDFVDYFNETNELLDTNFWGSGKKISRIVKVFDPNGLDLANPRVTSRLLRSEIKREFKDNKFTTDRDTRTAIREFNDQRPGSDSRFDDKIVEQKEKAEGRPHTIYA